MRKTKQKNILIDASLTGGRGPAKQAYEFLTACKERGIPYILLTNQSFTRKLKELGINADIVLPVELSSPREKLYQVYYQTLKNIDFDLLVKFGARTASTYNAQKLKKPFVVVDGGLPDTLEEYPSLYAKEGYLSAEKYILTTHFPWQYPNRTPLENIALTTYPFLKRRLTYAEVFEHSKEMILLMR